MTRLAILSLALATATGLTNAQTITTTWADQSIIGVVTDDGQGYTWTAVISTLGPAVPGAPTVAAVPTPLNAAPAPAADATSTTAIVAAAAADDDDDGPNTTQTAPGPPPPGPTEVTVVPSSGHRDSFEEYQSSVGAGLAHLGTEAFQGFTSAANIQGLSIPHFGNGAASRSALPSIQTLTGLLGVCLVPALLGLGVF